MFKGTPDSVSFLVESSLDSEENNWSLSLLLKIFRSWIILPISGAPGVGQNSSHFERTDIPDLVRL